MFRRGTLSAVCLTITVFTGTTFADEPGRGGKIQVEDIWARRAPMMDTGDRKSGSGNGAIYATLVNPGRQNDRLVAVATDAAETAEIHETHHHMGMVMMHQVRQIEVPAGQKVDLKPGGYHIMLLNLKRGLKAGEAVSLTLQFNKAGRIPATATIR